MGYFFPPAIAVKELPNTGISQFEKRLVSSKTAEKLLQKKSIAKASRPLDAIGEYEGMYYVVLSSRRIRKIHCWQVRMPPICTCPLKSLLVCSRINQTWMEKLSTVNCQHVFVSQLNTSWILMYGPFCQEIFFTSIKGHTLQTTWFFLAKVNF